MITNVRTRAARAWNRQSTLLRKRAVPAGIATACWSAVAAGARAVARRIVAGRPRCRSAGGSRLPVSLASGAAHTALILHAVANDGEMRRQTQTRRSRQGGPNPLQICLD